MDKPLDELLSIRQLSGLDFEKFVLNIIQLETEARGKELYKGNSGIPFFKQFFRLDDNIRFQFDAIAPFGIEDSVFTIIEAKKTSRLISEAIDQIKQIVSRYENLIKKHDETDVSDGRTKLLLIVSSGRIVKRFFAEEHKDSNVEIWSLDDLVERAKLYPFEYNAFLELVISHSFGKEAISGVKDKLEYVSEKDFEEQNKRLINELIKCFGKNRISLVLGTGVSMDYNNKLSWNALSSRLYDKLDSGKKFVDLENSISILGGDNISAVQYSKRNLGLKYSTTLYSLIYPKKNAYNVGNSSLDECANLVMRNNRDGKGIAKIITYNYDNYFEQALKARGCSFHVLYRQMDFLIESIPIYHVHGYMPEGSTYAERLEYIKTVILSEEDYFNWYGDSSNWNVAIQLETFKDDVCLFIGNSISDFNEKRLLNKTRIEKTKSHFAIFETKGLSFSDLAKIYMHFFYELNVKVIWAKTLNDIPKVIKSIKWKTNEPKGEQII